MNFTAQNWELSFVLVSKKTEFKFCCIDVISNKARSFGLIKNDVPICSATLAGDIWGITIWTPWSNGNWFVWYPNECWDLYILVFHPLSRLYIDDCDLIKISTPLCSSKIQGAHIYNHNIQSLRIWRKFCSIPSSIYSWFLKPLSVLHSRFPTKKLWVVAYFWNFLWSKKKLKAFLCNFLMRTLKFFFKFF
jgi:hypothetical protein